VFREIGILVYQIGLDPAALSNVMALMALYYAVEPFEAEGESVIWYTAAEMRKIRV
jgi:hypothetical protein